jgi:endonuclease/exonuclease/phosphatase family metal-dependent hydrolase
MAFLADEVAARAHAIVMGDLNCDLESVELRLLLDNAPLRPAAEPPRTFPSWRPRWQIDHILVTPELVPVRAYAPPWPFSDHLPIAMEVRLPAGVGVLGHPTALDPS